MRQTDGGVCELMLRMCLVGILACLGACSAPAATTQRDLGVEEGSITHAGYYLSGTFTVTNAGKPTPGTRAELRVVGPKSVTVAEFRVAPLPTGVDHRIDVQSLLPTLPTGEYAIRACTTGTDAVSDPNPSNDCLDVGTMTISENFCNTTACDPRDLPRGISTRTADSSGGYQAWIPTDHDGTYALLIWLHGCGGHSAEDTEAVRDRWGYGYITLAPEGAGGECWEPENPANAQRNALRVLNAVRFALVHFDIDPKRVVVGGYSSGGELAYKAAFESAETFAGVLAFNTQPFHSHDTHGTREAPAVDRKFTIVHIAHTDDDAYPIADVKSDIDALRAAGFPIVFNELAGHHWVPDNQPDDRPCDGGPEATMCKIQQLLIKEHMDDSWVAP